MLAGTGLKNCFVRNQGYQPADAADSLSGSNIFKQYLSAAPPS
jgi:hypothetical protein